MAGALIQEQIDEREVLKVFGFIGSKTKDKTPAMKSIGQYMIRRTQERFSAEHDPEGNPWTPLSAMTYSRSFKGKRFTRKGLSKKFTTYILNRKILTKTHQLRHSITDEATNESVTIGTNKIYAAIHQFGGMAGRGKKTKIPARQYLGINNEDRTEFGHIIWAFYGLEA
jgi:phage virion morphogenesis protein